MTTEEAFVAEYERRCKTAWPKEIPRETHYPFGRVPVTEYLRKWAECQPEKPALIFYGREFSYRELNELSDKLATVLAEAGVGRGDRVAIFLDNCPQFHFVFYGILKLEAIVVPISPLFKAFELQHELNETGARAIVASRALREMVESARGETSLETVITTDVLELVPDKPTMRVPVNIGGQQLPEGRDEFDLMTMVRAATPASSLPVPALDAVAVLNFTGGTTGLPKGCIHTHDHLVFTAASAVTFVLRGSPAMVSVSYFPVFWLSGENAGLVVPIVSGGTVVLLARWDAVAFMEAAQRYKATHAKVLVDHVIDLLDHPDRTSYDLSSLALVNGIGFVKKLTIDLRRRWKADVGSTLAEGGWGMSETRSHDTFTSGMQVDDFDLTSGQGFMGLPVPETAFKICDFDTGQVLDFGQEGEICMRSPSILNGYWRRPEASQALLRNGWLHSGDVGMISEQGYLYFLGRRRDMLKVRGMSVFPPEIEAVIGQHPAVLRCAVVGRPDDQKGDQPVAFIELQPGHSTSAEEMVRWCRDRISAYKVPEVRIVEGMPMTATGKVKKGELKNMFTL